MCTQKLDNDNWKNNLCNIKIALFCKQLWVSLGVVVNSIGQGCVMGYITIFLDQLRTPNTLIQISSSDGSWMASIMGLGLLVGNLVTPYLMEKYGRKITHIVTCVPIMTGWIFFIFSNSVPVLVFARLLQGCSLGMTPLLAGIIIGECSSPANRGFFLIAKAFGLAFGALFVHIVGYFLHWRLTAVVSGMFSFLSLIMIILSPETPTWLASKQQYDKSREVFTWLRGSDNKDHLQELEIMINARKVEHEADLKNTQINITNKIMQREFYIPIIIMFHLYLLYVFSGFSIFISYTIDILNHLLGSKQDPYVWMMITDVLRLVAVIIASIILRLFKRRILLFSSGSVCFASLIAISVYSFLKTYYIAGNAIIPLVFIFTYVFSLNVGITALPFVISGEIFPVRYKSLGGGMSSVVMSVSVFVSIKTGLPLFETIGVHGTFFMYALIVFYCLLVLWFMLPETKDKTLQEIEDEIRGAKYDDIDVTDLKLVEPLKSRSNSKVKFNNLEKNDQLLVGEKV